MTSVPNFKQITPGEAEKLAPLLRHYAKQAHPFTACVRDNTKRFGKDRAERVCAVLKDRIRGTTKWRGKEMSEDQMRALIELAHRAGATVDLARDSDPDVIELAGSRAGLVPTKVTVRSRSGKTFQRTMWLRPKQAKQADKSKKGAPAEVSKQGADVMRASRAVLAELGKMPREDRTQGWQDAVKALASMEHGGRLGPARRKALRALQSSASDGPLKDAVTAALQADAPKGKAKKEQQAKQAKEKKTKARKQSKAKGRELRKQLMAFRARTGN